MGTDIHIVPAEKQTQFRKDSVVFLRRLRELRNASHQVGKEISRLEEMAEEIEKEDRICRSHIASLVEA